MEIDEAFIRNFWDAELFARESEVTAPNSDLRHSEIFWAMEYVDEAVRAGDVAVVRVILELAEAVPQDEFRLGFLGAGPIENLLCDGESPPSGAMVDAIHRAALSSQPFREALESVWWTDSASPELVARINSVLSSDVIVEERTD